MNAVKCQVSGKEVEAADSTMIASLTPSLQAYIKKRFPESDTFGYVANAELLSLRKEYVEDLIKEDLGEISMLEQEVLQSVSSTEFISKDVETELDKELSLGDRLADSIASFGGSWTFILSFMAFVLGWMAVNVWMMVKPFDQFPFILLNLILSCLAAIQAPLIMMSQNRQEDKDRERSKRDYQVNLKAELEIKLLHEKVDYLLKLQNRKLLEIQQVQTDMLNQLMDKLNNQQKPQS